MSCRVETPPEMVCNLEKRRHEVRRLEFNGIDYLEVSDDQLVLTVFFLGPAPEGVGLENVVITGGARICDIEVVDVKLCPEVDPDLDNCIVVTVDKPGDFSNYTLCLVGLPAEARFDPRYLCVDFTFTAACPTDLDCKREKHCPEEVVAAPNIDYLAKDFSSFRQLILDRLSVLMPDWTERHVPDIGITLVELFAYVGDHLSYFQDAVATEAYLATARQRISVRRHARLVDYRLHEGCNARAWVAIHTSGDHSFPAGALSFLTELDPPPDTNGKVSTWNDIRDVPKHLYEVFEPMGESGAPVQVFAAHNTIRFYTWGDDECCLPRGAVSATLVDGTPPVQPGFDGDGTGSGGETDERLPGDPNRDTAPDGPPPTDAQTSATNGRVLNLSPGDVLILTEVRGPRTGAEADADPARRHAVRLTHVELAVDPLNGQPLLKVKWACEDALPFPFCLSAIVAPDCRIVQDISVALGNVVLADHGRTCAEPRDLGCVPLASEEITCLAEDRPGDPVRRAGRFEHGNIEGPLTFAAPVSMTGPAAAALEQDPRAAVPVLHLTSTPDPECGPQASGAESLEWTPRFDLLASGAEDAHFVVEMDDRRRAHLRFGDGQLGRRPDPGVRFKATWRTGNGPAGRIGADKLTLALARHPVDGLELRPRNPLPARGGVLPEPVSEAKLYAPHAFKTIRERAVIPADYAEIAARHDGVQRAAAEMRWNGSWYEIRVYIDPFDRAQDVPKLLADVRRYLHRYRRIGHDLAVREAVYVPLDIVMQVCVAPTYLRAHVEVELRRRFSNGILPDGTPSFFHSDALTFGDNIALSRLVAAAHTVEGVDSVTVKVLERLFEGPNGELAAGLLPIGPLEVARLDSDPNFPENGRIRFDMRGGR